MRQLDFIGTWEDSWAIIETILVRGDVGLIPDLRYDSPNPMSYTKLNEQLKDFLHQRPRLYLWCQEFSRFPPVLVEISSGLNAGKFFLRLCLGGPGLELTLPACFEADGLLKLNFGSLSYARETLNPETGLYEKPSVELKAGFADIRTRLLKNVLKKHSGILTGPDAMRLLEAGQAQLVRPR